MKLSRPKWLARLSRSKKSSETSRTRQQEIVGGPNQSSSLTPGAESTVEVDSIPIAADQVSRHDERSDLWSRAYQEAVSNLASDLQSRIPTTQNIEQLLCELEKTNQVAGNSLFRKGLVQLRGPLQGFKLALDIAKPLSTMEPAASIAVGVVSGVTAIAIAVCGAEEKLNDRITEMLQKIPIIDECDLLGQKLGADSKIHMALVLVYQDLLEFYITASNILTSKVFLVAILRDDLSNSLPSIVENFLIHIQSLRFSIEQATLGLLEQIQKQLLETKIQKILGIEKEKQRSNFHLHVRDSRAEGACTWLDTDPRYLHWYNNPSSDSTVLFGDMGSGKTYVTSHVVEKLRVSNVHQLPRPLFCYHYCNDRETANSVYIYASLILQLLDQQKGLMVDFDKWNHLTKSEELIDPAQSSVALGTFLIDNIGNLDRQVFIIIDGLDECVRASQKSITSLFSNLCVTARRTKVFLSSRPTKMIKHLLSDWATINLTPDLKRDQIVAQYTISKHLSGLESDGRDTLLEALSRLADGNAQWIKVLVELVARKGVTTNGGIKSFLCDLPNSTELSKVYAKAFSQAVAGDTENGKLLTNALEILSVAQRPLSIEELSAAVLLAGSTKKLRSVDEIQDLMDAGRILALLQPFLPYIDFKDVKTRQVKLRHHSVRELVWRETPSAWERLSDDTRLSDDRVKKRQARLEGNLLQMCVQYLLLEEIDLYDLFPEEFKAALEWQHLPEGDVFDNLGGSPDLQNSAHADSTATGAEIVSYDPVESRLGPFFAYASCFWCDHLQATDQEFLPEIKDIVLLCRAGSKRLQNWTQQQLYPECTIRPSFGFDSNDLDALTILSLSGSQGALKSLLQHSNLNSQDFLGDTLKRTFDKLGRLGKPSCIYLIFKYRNQALDFPTFDFLYALMSAWKRSNKDLTEDDQYFDVIYDMFDKFVEEGWGTMLLCAAVKFDCLPVIKILLDAAKQNSALRRDMLEHSGLPSNVKECRSFILDAVQYSSYETLEYLLNQEVARNDLHRLDEKQNNIFHVAALQNNAEKVALLLRFWKAGADQSNVSHETPLDVAVFGNHLDVARELLTTGGVDVRGGSKADGSAWEGPLRTAIRGDSLAMCRLLVEVGGAEPRSALESRDGQLSLKDSLGVSPSMSNMLHYLANASSSEHAT